MGSCRAGLRERGATGRGGAELDAAPLLLSLVEALWARGGGGGGEWWAQEVARGGAVVGFVVCVVVKASVAVTLAMAVRVGWDVEGLAWGPAVYVGSLLLLPAAARAVG